MSSPELQMRVTLCARTYCAQSVILLTWQVEEKEKAEESGIPELYPAKKHIKSAVIDKFGYLKRDQVVVLHDGYPICTAYRWKFAAKGSNMSNMSRHRQDNHQSLCAPIKSS